jgi:hypothetical protein
MTSILVKPEPLEDILPSWDVHKSKKKRLVVEVVVPTWAEVERLRRNGQMPKKEERDGTPLLVSGHFHQSLVASLTSDLECKFWEERGTGCERELLQSTFFTSVMESLFRR